MGRFLPQLIDYDDQERVLILSLVPDANNLRETHAELAAFPPALGAALGAALASVHDASGSLAAGAGLTQSPWILSVHKPDIAMYREASGPSIQLIKIIQGTPGFSDRLATVAASPSAASVVHNDLKWDNVLATPVGTDEWRVTLIDWEGAVVGDACWDVGSAFAQYLIFWIQSMPLTGSQPPADLPQLAAFPLDSMKPSINALWSAYVDGRGLSTAAQEMSLVRSIELAAARLLQWAFEGAQVATELSSTLVLALQLSANLLSRPRDAATRLFGLPAGAPA